MFGIPRQAGASRTAVVHSNAARAVAVVNRRGAAKPCLVHASAEGKPKTGLAWRATQALLQSAPPQRGGVSAVLPSNEYQLLLTEAPDVPEAELRAAMRWRIRDQVDTPIDQATIDVFRIPQVRGKANLVQVVVTPTWVIDELEAIVKRVNRRLDVIDIPELALRNVLRLLPQDELGCALVLVSRGTLHILICARGVLYVARRIELTHGPGSDQIALELQRSLQYYESQFDRPALQDVIVAPESDAAATLAAELAANTGLQCVPLSLSGVLERASGVGAIDRPELLIAVGAALRPSRLGAPS